MSNLHTLLLAAMAIGVVSPAEFVALTSPPPGDEPQRPDFATWPCRTCDGQGMWGELGPHGHMERSCAVCDETGVEPACGECAQDATPDELVMVGRIALCSTCAAVVRGRLGDARDVACPQCRAGVGAACNPRTLGRHRFHLARVIAWEGR